MRGIVEYSQNPGVREEPTQTVKELRDFLATFPDDLLVAIDYDGEPCAIQIAHSNAERVAPCGNASYPEEMLLFDI